MDGQADTRLGGGSLELSDLRRDFGAVKALDGLSFTVAPGRLFGFVGRNGAGKTTTMRIVCGLLAPGRGHCHLARPPGRRAGPWADRLRAGGTRPVPEDAATVIV